MKARAARRSPTQTPIDEIEDGARQREPCYEKAGDWAVDTAGLTVAEVTSLILDEYQKVSGNEKNCLTQSPAWGSERRRMAGNTFGEVFRITTFGESHGTGSARSFDGCPAQLALVAGRFRPLRCSADGPAREPHDTPRCEEDQVEILSGVFEGKTTGAPITLLVRNRDANSRPYEILRQVFRPGHADFTYFKKYGHFDFRGGGRYSARETAAEWPQPAWWPEKVLAPLGIRVVAYTLELGGIRAQDMDLARVEESPFFCPDLAASREMEKRASEVMDQGDSLDGCGGDPHDRLPGRPRGAGL